VGQGGGSWIAVYSKKVATALFVLRTLKTAKTKKKLSRRSARHTATMRSSVMPLAAAVGKSAGLI